MAGSISLLQICGVSKAFPDKYEPRSPKLFELFGRASRSAVPALALDKCDFELQPGEMHVLTGEHGSGKSTLAAILSGMRRVDSGALLVAGAEVALASPLEAQRLGVVIAPQDPSLALSLSVIDNLFMGRELRHGPFINRGLQHKRARELFERLGMEDIPLAHSAGELDPAHQRMLAIARAISHEHMRALILDEPAFELDDSQLQLLRGIIAELRTSGVAVLYITQKLSQVRDIADRVSVMRAGRVLGTYSPAEDIERLIIEAALRLS